MKMRPMGGSAFTFRESCEEPKKSCQAWTGATVDVKIEERLAWKSEIGVAPQMTGLPVAA